jgi:hypothetical protein
MKRSTVLSRRLPAAVLAGGATLAAAALTAMPAPAAGPPGCPTSGLVVWLDTQGNGAAGSVYYNLEFTNQSGSTCALQGFPGVSAVSLVGRQLGNAASRSLPARRSVTLANGATATAVLRIVDVGNFSPSACRPVAAAGLRVFPPNRTSAKTVPFPFQACSRGGVTYLSVQAIKR